MPIIANIIHFGMPTVTMLGHIPPWLAEQRGLTYHEERTKPKSRFMGKSAIVAKYARDLQRRDGRVTHSRLRVLLRWLRRGYALDPQSISRLLHGVYPDRSRFEKYPNGHRVQVNDRGKVKMYKSLNEAARAEGCSPESVRLWARSRRPNRKGQVWQYLDLAAQRSTRRR